MKRLVNVVFNINQDYLTNTLKEYTFAAYEELSVGDVVVVDTRNGFQLVTVTGVVEKLPGFLSNESLKDVVSKVDFSEFTRRQEKREKAKQLKTAMDRKVKLLQNQAIYEMLAEKDSELKSMLDEYKEICEV